jgi:hypothetical protein
MYPLITQKKADFLLFKLIVNLMNLGAHLNSEGLKKIISYQGAMNKGVSTKLKNLFPDVIIAERPLV